MTDENRSLIAKLLVPVGTLYLVSLALQPPPARWVGLGCLAVVVPLLVARALGTVAGIGPWADGEAD
ncbi:hypothetical protein SAMN05216559_1953 [Halomicrobium zhouii]|uniref:Uncharacterized protein n=1 Tax=Halomicrobium zhouii TaxID=767519 RepID=A0A1I6L3I5_9EURY|nr:hypothetical protein [Halomicrobium zhouii]SFR97992.1 hypothetical protein SAMN05216559_1953 [Halomicrobium zhouii]